MRPMAAPGILMGLGLGGFIDGILFHQILQWHHLTSHIEPPTTLGALEATTRADGLFHAAAWLLVVAAVGADRNQNDPMPRANIAPAVALIAFSLAACTSEVSPQTTLAPPAAPTSSTSTDPEASTATIDGEESTTPDPTTTVAPTAAPSLPSDLEPTPAQSEGPFYPVTKPDDRDNDLLSVDGSTEAPDGTPLELYGLLVDTSGNPIEGATIEIWQVDNQGIYDHPGDEGTDQRDRRFQFYGETLSDGAGAWRFLTIQPVPYEPRPAHIHVKVLVDGSEALTSQIYFADDPLVASDGIAAGTDGLDRLIVTPVPATLSNGMEGMAATHIIVLE